MICHSNGQRFCVDCKKWYPETEFYKMERRGGKVQYLIRCKACERSRRLLQGTRIQGEPAKMVCRCCGVEKGIKAFYRNNNNACGYDTKCIECIEREALERYEKRMENSAVKKIENILQSGFKYILVHVTESGESEFDYWRRLEEWELSKVKPALIVTDASDA